LAIPRSTLAQWVGVTRVQLQPLVDALRDVMLGQQVIHADETPVQMLIPGTKKTHRYYVWAYATSQFSDVAAVVYDSAPAGRVNMLVTSCKTGGAKWCVMILAATRPVSSST
jgi:hypothetical protein